MSSYLYSWACTMTCPWTQAGQPLSYREGYQYHLVLLWKTNSCSKVFRCLGKNLATCPTYPPFPCACPQRAWREAEEDLRATQQVLEEAKERLREVESGIAMLQDKYKMCIAKKEELEMKCEQCQQRLGRADMVSCILPAYVRQPDFESRSTVMKTSLCLQLMTILG